MASPDGTFAKQIVDNQGNTWLFGPNGETARCSHIDNGVGDLYCWYGDKVYVRGTDFRWYVFVSNHWIVYGPEPPIPIPQPPVVALPRLTTRGAFFQLETGEYFTVIECTDFRLFQMFLNGEDVSPILRQRSEIGFNTLRILGSCHNMFRLYPSEYPDYYTSLAPFMGFCASFGLRVEFTVFADATLSISSRNDQFNHWNRVGQELLGSTNVILELVNEENQPVNRLAAVNMVSPIAGILCSHGSNGSEARPVRPWWNYETFHTNQAFEWWRKSGHNAMELTDGDPEGNISPSHVPILTNENTRPDQDSDINHHEDSAASSALLNAGYCHHSDAGKFSRLFNTSEMSYALAAIRGMSSVPLIYQDGRYIRHPPAEFLRVYERRIDGGNGFVVRIRK